MRLPAIGSHKMVELSHHELELLEQLSRDTPAGEADRAVDDVVRAAVEDVVQRGGDEARLESLVVALRDRRRLGASDSIGLGEPSLFDDLAARSTSGGAPIGVDAIAGAMRLTTPGQAAVHDGEFLFFDREAVLVARLSARQLAAISEFRYPVTIDEATAAQQATLGDAAMADDELRSLAVDLASSGVLVPATESEILVSTQRGRGEALAAREMKRLRDLVTECYRHAEARPALRAREQKSSGAPPRPYVVPYHKTIMIPPLGLGMILANAMAYDGGRLKKLYDFEPNWVARRSTIKRLLRDGPSVVLFSSYVWSHTDNVVVSELVKRLSPDSVTIHGGPDVPSRPAECEAYFRANPHVDVTVRGEGEMATAEILDVLGGSLRGRDGRFDGFDEIPGITYRRADGAIIRTADRERLADLDVLPSPYLTDVFDPFAKATMPAYIIETNRGCPYGCTFCDWGSATQSRIRKFSMERVFAELEWGSKHGMPRTTIADANFGILPRDVEIAEHLAALKRQYGFPFQFGSSFAKNTTKNLKHIISVLADAGVLSDGTVSLQTIDPDTLSAINRSNIKVEQYEALARTFREAGLPLFADLMFGLPGSTPATLRNDLQHCINNETSAKVFSTELLVNSPMNDPEYRERYQIQAEVTNATKDTRGRPLLVSTSSYTREEYEQMKGLRDTFVVGENLAVFRYLGRFIRQETGRLESVFLDDLDREMRRDPHRYPVLAWAVESLPEFLVPPSSWAVLFEDVERYVVCELGLAPSSALRTVLTVQRTVLPERGRSFPEEVELEHDFAGWFRAVVDAKDRGLDWCEEVPRLSTFGPATFTVDDPDDLCFSAIGSRIGFDLTQGWELSSAITRVHTAQHLAPA